MIVYAVRYGNYEPPEVLELYDNHAAAHDHAAELDFASVVPMTVRSTFDRSPIEDD